MNTRWIPVILAGLFACPAAARVDAQASRTHLAENETLELTVTSDSADFPNLGGLERDFTILNRGMSTSGRSINGQTSHRTRLTLTLMPRHSGDLTVPAIRFGDQASRPIPIQVTGGVTDSAAKPAPAGSGRVPPWFSGQPYGMGPGLNDWMSPQGSAGGSAPRDRTGDGFATPVTPPQTDRPALTALPESPPPPRDEDAPTDYWPWLTGIAVAGWLTTSLLLLRGRNRERKRFEGRPSSPPVARKPKRSPVEIEGEVQGAYDRADPFAAKSALLQWGEAVWPADPPTNLSRMAARCPPELQRYILQLEEAIYSPRQESDWSRHPMREQLGRYRTAHPDAGEDSRDT